MELKWKEVQVFETSKRLMLMGAPNNMERDVLKSLLCKRMTATKNKMMEKYPDKCSPFVWGSPSPDFDVNRDFLKNGVWELRDDNEDLQIWSKVILHVETAVYKEFLFKGCLEHMQKMGGILETFCLTLIVLLQSRSGGQSYRQEVSFYRG